MRNIIWLWVPKLFILASLQNFKVNTYFHAPQCQKYKLPSCNCVHGNCSPTYFDNISCSSKCFLIEKVDEFKYLGLTIDSRMNFLNHTNNLRQYLRCTLRHFYYLRSIVSTDLLKTIYYGIFQSKLQYGIACWGGAYLNKIQPLLVLQKYVLRKICRKASRQPSFPLFCDLKILPVRHLYCFKVLKTFFMKSGNRNFRLISSHGLRGNSLNMYTVPFFRTTAFRNFYSIFSFRLFNKLPHSIRAISSLGLFIKHLKIWLFGFNYSNFESFISGTLV